MGTSGWYYRDWPGTFYPVHLKKQNFLACYAESFKTVELNGTFYHLPLDSTAKTWYRSTPRDFVFSVKASRFITHIKKLKDAREPLERFLKWSALLKEKLGPILFQLPPHWGMDGDRLESFLKLLPKRRPFVFEFRDPSWFCEEIYQRLRHYQAALCIYDREGLVSPFVLTAPWVYVRFHGPEPRYHGDYSPAALKLWARRIRQWLADRKQVFAYFNNDYQGYAPKNARELMRLLLKKSSLR